MYTVNIVVLNALQANFAECCRVLGLTNKAKFRHLRPEVMRRLAQLRQELAWHESLPLLMGVKYRGVCFAKVASEHRQVTGGAVCFEFNPTLVRRACVEARSGSLLQAAG